MGTYIMADTSRDQPQFHETGNAETSGSQKNMNDSKMLANQREELGRHNGKEISVVRDNELDSKDKEYTTTEPRKDVTSTSQNITASEKNLSEIIANSSENNNGHGGQQFIRAEGVRNRVCNNQNVNVKEITTKTKCVHPRKRLWMRARWRWRPRWPARWLPRWRPRWSLRCRPRWPSLTRENFRFIWSYPINWIGNRIQGVLLMRRDFVVDPEGDAVYFWLSIVSLSVLYNFWAVILRIAFEEMRVELVPRLAFFVSDIVCDVVYLMDIMLQFRMGYLEDGILVEDPIKLAEHYMKRRKKAFFLDIFSGIPFPSIFLIFSGLFSQTSSLTGVKDGVTYMLFRLPKLLKWHTMNTFENTSDMKTNNPNGHRAAKLMVYLATTIHWIGCIYYCVSEYEGLGSTEWTLSVPEEEGFGRKYLCSVYWSTMILTTIGDTWGSPQTNVEYIFTGLTFLVGVFMFATVVGNVGDVISNMNAAKVDFQQKMDNIKLYMTANNIPGDIQNRVKRWAEYSWNRTQMMDDEVMLDILPFRLKAEIAQQIHLATLQKVKIFEECERGLLCDLVVRLRSQIYSPGDYICRKGEIGREMYFINHGKVDILIPNPKTGEPMRVATLGEGTNFGEISLLKMEDGNNRRNADVRSVGYSELLVLSKRDLHHALVEYPEARKALEKQAKERMVKNAADAAKREQELKEKEERENSPKVMEKNKSQNQLQVEQIEKERAETRHKEREMGELRHILHQLKSFDSLATKSRMQLLQQKCAALEVELKRRTRILHRAQTRISRLELQLVGRDKDNGVRRTSLWSDGEDTKETVINKSHNDSLNNQLVNSRCLPTYKHDKDDLLSDVSSSLDLRLQKSTISGFQVVSVVIPGIAINDTMEQEPQVVQMTLPLNISDKHGKHVLNYVNGVDPEAPPFDSDHFLSILTLSEEEGKKDGEIHVTDGKGDSAVRYSDLSESTDSDAETDD